MSHIDASMSVVYLSTTTWIVIKARRSPPRIGGGAEHVVQWEAEGALMGLTTLEADRTPITGRRPRGYSCLPQKARPKSSAAKARLRFASCDQ